MRASLRLAASPGQIDTAVLVEWIHTEALRLGLNPPRAISLASDHPWARVYRVDGCGEPLWCKANGPAFAHEGALLRVLAEYAADAIPRIAAVDDARGWLLLFDAGEALEDVLARDRDIGHWERALTRYALLQRALDRDLSIFDGVGIPAAGPAQIPGILSELLRAQSGLAAGELRALERSVPIVAAWCAELAGIGVPITIQHDDLTDDNIYVRGGRFVYLDWADAALAHPFGSLIYPERLACQRFGLAPDGPEVSRLRDAYLEIWTDKHSKGELDRARELAVACAAVGRAASWTRALTGVDRQRLDHYEAAAEARWLRTILRYVPKAT